MKSDRPKLKTSHRKRKQSTPKRSRKKRARRMSVPTTHNGRIISNMMVSNGVSGNHKDYVILVGKVIMDWVGSYEMQIGEGKTIGAKGMALVHKARLFKFIGPAADKFWNKKIGMRRQPDPESRERLKDKADGTSQQSARDEAEGTRAGGAIGTRGDGSQAPTPE